MTSPVERDQPSLAALTAELRAEEQRIGTGGRQAASERQHAKDPLTARERIARLVHPNSQFIEIGVRAAWEMYQEWGGAPAAGVVCGLGTIAGRRHMVIANDATV